MASIIPAWSSTTVYTLTSGSSLTTLSPATPQIVFGDFSIEFIIDPGVAFNGCQLISTDDNSISIRFISNWSAPGQDSIPYLRFSTTHSTGTDNYDLEFDGADRLWIGYFQNGNKKHCIFSYDNTNKIKKVYIDGFSFSASTLSSNLITSGSSNHRFYLNSNTSYRKIIGEVEKVRIYNQVISDKQAYQHYLDCIVNNLSNYSYAESISVPTAPNFVLNAYSTYDFASGTTINSLDANGNTTITNRPVVDQLSSWVDPRYRSDYSDLPPLFNWLGYSYLTIGGGSAPSNNSTTTSILKSILEEMSYNWNYSIPVMNYFQDSISTNLNTWTGMMLKLANDNPSIPADIKTYRAQLSITGSTSAINYDSFPNNHYLQNGTGQFLDNNGAVTTTNKQWRPTSSTTISYLPDGVYVKSQLELVAKYLSGRTSPLNYIFENAECVIPLTDSVYNSDPVVQSEQTSSGVGMQNYVARKYHKLFGPDYKDVIKSGILSSATYMEYAIDGFTDNAGNQLGRFKYDEVYTINDNNRSTGDFYPRRPSNWRNYQGADRGLLWFEMAKVKELGVNTQRMFPFISAGWSNDERSTIRPGQWLGLCKHLLIFGAETFNVGYFNLNPPFQNPYNYAWQIAAPAYVQALRSIKSNIWDNGTILTGDVPRSYDSPGSGAGYNYYAGNLSSFVCALNLDDEYLISANINRNTNYSGQTSASTLTFNLNGNQISVKGRDQGNIYYFNSTSNLLYPLDEWHESSHFDYWDKTNFIINSEISNSTVVDHVVTMEGVVGNDYSNSNAYVEYNFIQTDFSWTKYNYRFRNSGTGQVWIKFKSSDGSPTGLKISTDQQKWTSIYNQSNTDWQYVQMPIDLSITANHEDFIYIKPNNYFCQIDKIKIKFVA